MYKQFSITNTVIVSLDEAKKHLRAEHFTDDDIYIQTLTEVAIERFQFDTGRQLKQAVYDLFLDKWPNGYDNIIRINKVPVSAVESVKYIDSNQTEQTFGLSNFVTDFASEPARLVLKNGVSFPSLGQNANAVTIRFTCGYTNNVPNLAKQCIKLLIHHFYTMRQNVQVGNIVTEVPGTYEDLIQTFKTMYLCTT